MTKKYVIVAKCYDKRGRILSIGTNSYSKTHTIQSYYAKKVGLDVKEYLHSEIQALIRAGDKQVHRLTVERYNADGQPALAKPCPVCSEAIRAYGVKEVWYTSPQGFVKEKVK